MPEENWMEKAEELIAGLAGILGAGINVATTIPAIIAIVKPLFPAELQQVFTPEKTDEIVAGYIARDAQANYPDFATKEEIEAGPIPPVEDDDGQE